MAGKIFAKEEADKLFGPVLYSVAMGINEFNSLMAMTEKHVMFRVENGKLFILGDGRKVLFPKGASVTSEEVFSWADKSMVAELLNLCKENEVFVENREIVLSVTYGSNTLEQTILCPPFCP